MDTLFRLVSLQTSDQQSSFTSSRTSSSSAKSFSKTQQPHYEDSQECYYTNNYYMDEDFSSSSSSKQSRPPSTTPPPRFDFTLPPNINLDFSSSSSSSQGGRWANDLLLQCAEAVARHDSQRVQQLMWMLNELTSPYGDTDQKLASYFLQALFARLTSSGPRTLATLSVASDRNCSFDSTRRLALRFQDLSPWHSFGHVAANGAILESFLDAGPRLHILDLSNTFCTQWPTLLEALATRSSDDTPHLSITTVIPSAASSTSVHRVMKEIGARMEKFARLMGVPFRFHAVHHSGDLSNLDLTSLYVPDAALAVNCVNSLRTVPPTARRRDALLAAIRQLRPRIVTVIEEDADLVACGDDEEDAFIKTFQESLSFFSAYFDSLEESFPRTSNERLALERAAGRSVVDLLACPAADSAERRETAGSWSRRLRSSGFASAAFSDDVADDVRALLRRYREGWSMRAAEESGAAGGVLLAWKEQPVVWASAWRP